MREKLKCILLIDDDEATNFIHTMVINKSEVTEKVVAMQRAEEALEYLTTMENGKYPQPDLVFLDINMPGMDGWEFLEEYKKLNPEQKASKVLIMLTTSLNPEDRENADGNNEISGFMNKPLTKEMLSEIIEEHFS